MKLYIGNSFSLSMLDEEAQLGDPCDFVNRFGPCRVRIPRPVKDVRAFMAEVLQGSHMIESILGHPSSQALFESELGIDVPVNRKAIRLTENDYLLAGQVVNQDGEPVRLPEGATTLPEGVCLKWWVV